MNKVKTMSMMHGGLRQQPSIPDQMGKHFKGMVKKQGVDRMRKLSSSDSSQSRKSSSRSQSSGGSKNSRKSSNSSHDLSGEEEGTAEKEQRERAKKVKQIVSSIKKEAKRRDRFYKSPHAKIKHTRGSARVAEGGEGSFLYTKSEVAEVSYKKRVLKDCFYDPKRLF